MRKGAQRRATILDVALDMASRDGREGLTIGLSVERFGMTKSRVFAHFGAREVLPLAVIREYHERVEREVFYPALRAPRGLSRLRALLPGWLACHTRELDSGCMDISGAVERAGPLILANCPPIPIANNWSSRRARWCWPGITMNVF